MAYFIEIRHGFRCSQPEFGTVTVNKLELHAVGRKTSLGKQIITLLLTGSSGNFTDPWESNIDVPDRPLASGHLNYC